ncbi:MAG: NAD(P)/FAD-dependent oxidoreductase [Thermodesulfobacteriota bacterium]
MQPEQATPYDVIVVGGGFGGAVAAWKCARAGLKTLIVERSREVGDKIISGLTIPFHGFLFGPDFIRDGNPPIERPVDGIVNYIITDIDRGEIHIDDTLMVPKPFSPVFAVGYNAYCKDFCRWEMQQAVAAGAELRTSTTITALTRQNGRVSGIETEFGERIGAKIVIDAEGSHGLLAIKAGIREKYPPDTISLADVYVYDMDKQDIDRIFGFSLRFCWGWDEQKIAPPLGHGNGLMVWPYRDSLHLMQDQCLRNDDGPVYNVAASLKTYHQNITAKLPWWRDQVAPLTRLRARMWDGFEIFVGLNERLRRMPNYAAGILLIGDAAGLENTELCDGVPAAWFSAEIAADVAIEAVRRNDTSAEFLRRYNDRILAHPIIQWGITSTNRYNLRHAQATRDEKRLRRHIHDGWGLGFCRYGSSALMRIVLEFVKRDPAVIGKWLRMYCRYYYNWHHGHFESDNTNRSRKTGAARELGRFFKGLDAILVVSGPLLRLSAALLLPLSPAANPIMRLLLPVVEPVYLRWKRRFEPRLEPLSRALVQRIVQSDPSVFEAQSSGSE